MQYSLPQFVDVEDQILPHLTVKQFLMLIFCGILGLVYWVIFGVGFIFAILMLLTLLVILPVTFYKFNGRSLLVNLPNLMRFVTAPRYRVFSRQGSAITVHKQQQAAVQESVGSQDAPVASRLKNLAYILDAQSAEEERLLRTTNPYENTKK
ncbi:MAG: hypothetical protein A2751_05875 [Candidatus Doudnabacteria bacterium RIFCSPHIGHO2_01_FULL_46_14]|uniref:PrgI family protein n=1 Tax=Candidatus Doudnabacteria bacterium RIFCSPHIGHO2_01_FULL_46_14 TaxID=1817824 RepID=A0A1F5NN71_9BACT|nr:MAG: hypothetical protein A2751_05875 [Candidatus Doudnabacteria bacterium RIFCSPHIGHO2_01_FULL_46_14]